VGPRAARPRPLPALRLARSLPATGALRNAEARSLPTLLTRQPRRLALPRVRAAHARDLVAALPSPRLHPHFRRPRRPTPLPPLPPGHNHPLPAEAARPRPLTRRSVEQISLLLSICSQDKDRGDASASPTSRRSRAHRDGDGARADRESRPGRGRRLSGRRPRGARSSRPTPLHRNQAAWVPAGKGQARRSRPRYVTPGSRP